MQRVSMVSCPVHAFTQAQDAIAGESSSMDGYTQETQESPNLDTDTTCTQLEYVPKTSETY